MLVGLETALGFVRDATGGLSAADKMLERSSALLTHPEMRGGGRAEIDALLAGADRQLERVSRAAIDIGAIGRSGVPLTEGLGLARLQIVTAVDALGKRPAADTAAIVENAREELHAALDHLGVRAGASSAYVGAAGHPGSTAFADASRLPEHESTLARAVTRPGPTLSGVAAGIDEQTARQAGFGLTDRAEGVRVGREIRDALGDSFAPIVDDQLRQLTRMRYLPLADLPRAGDPTVRTPFVPAESHQESALTTLGLLKDSTAPAGTKERLLRPVTEFVESRQWTISDGELESQNGRTITSAVGEYGSPLAHALVEAARVMDATAPRGAPLEVLRARDAELLAAHTFHADPLVTTLEGNGAFAMVFGQLTANRVANLTADQLLERIDRDGLVAWWAKASPSLLANLTYSGSLVKRAVTEDGGRLRISPELRELDAVNLGRRTAQGLVSPGTLAGCPLAKRGLEVARPDGTFRNDETYISSLTHEYVALARRFLAHFESQDEHSSSPLLRSPFLLAIPLTLG